MKTNSGKAARTPNAHRLSAAMKRQGLKGMSAVTARVWHKQFFVKALAWYGLGLIFFANQSEGNL